MRFRYFCGMKVFGMDIFDYLKSLDANTIWAENGSMCAEDACGEKVIVVPVALDFFRKGGTVRQLLDIRHSSAPAKTIYVYEDRWRASQTLIRSMLRTILGKGETVFARNTQVRQISAEMAADFLQKNHLYGSTKSSYRYGLFRTRATGENETMMGNTSNLIAVATFSAGKTFDHALSYEWIRYASVAGTRVVGGMGKLLKAFLKERANDRKRIADESESVCNSIEVMSYADLEWGEGDSYQKLGFKAVSDRESVMFQVDSGSFVRTHAGKYSTDRKYRNLSPEDSVEIFNLGSRKYIL